MDYWFVTFFLPAHTVIIPLAKYILPYVEHIILSSCFFPHVTFHTLPTMWDLLPFPLFYKPGVMDKNSQTNVFLFLTNNILTYSNQDGALSSRFLLLGCGLKFVNALRLMYIFDSFRVNVVYGG